MNGVRTIQSRTVGPVLFPTTLLRQNTDVTGCDIRTTIDGSHRALDYSLGISIRRTHSINQFASFPKPCVAFFGWFFKKFPTNRMYVRSSDVSVLKVAPQISNLNFQYGILELRKSWWYARRKLLNGNNMFNQALYFQLYGFIWKYKNSNRFLFRNFLIGIQLA